MKNLGYRFLSLSHFLLGLLQFSFTTWSYFVGEPGLRVFYAEMDIDYRTGFFWYSVLLIAGSINFIFSYKLWQLKKERLLIVAAVIFLFISFFLFFIVGFGKYSNVGVSGFPPQVFKFSN